MKTYLKDKSHYLVGLNHIKIVYPNGNTKRVTRLSLLNGIEALHAKEAVMLNKQYSLLL